MRLFLSIRLLFRLERLYLPVFKTSLQADAQMLSELMLVQDILIASGRDRSSPAHVVAVVRSPYTVKVIFLLFSNTFLTQICEWWKYHQFTEPWLEKALGPYLICKFGTLK